MSKQAHRRLDALPNLTRRGFLVGGSSAVALAACSNPNVESGGGTSTKNALGVELPTDAAPASEQYYVQPFDSTGASYKALDFYETVYSRAPLADQFTIPSFGWTRTTTSCRAQRPNGSSRRTATVGRSTSARGSCGPTAGS